jgi:hypothetical protein
MKIYIAGNELIESDRLPLEIIPELKKIFPALSFERVDPNENFIPEEGSVIIDSVDGISHVQLFTDIGAFVLASSVSAHDYDLGFHLMLLGKLHKLPHIKILGIPQRGGRENIREEIITSLRSVISPGQ